MVSCMLFIACDNIQYQSRRIISKSKLHPTGMSVECDWGSSCSKSSSILMDVNNLSRRIISKSKLHPTGMSVECDWGSSCSKSSSILMDVNNLSMMYFQWRGKTPILYRSGLWTPQAFCHGHPLGWEYQVKLTIYNYSCDRTDPSIDNTVHQHSLLMRVSPHIVMELWKFFQRPL